jgi:pyruvate/2-oxoglutarate/acetoin dehydrogenase E1 component
LGANGIVGGGLPIAVGAALSAKKRRTGAVAFFGDGANNEGAFHESLNIASIWKLPVVFVCENNQYAMSMAIARSTAVLNVADRAGAYGMPGVTLDGNDFATVAEAAFVATERARAGEGPTLIEAKTYRTRGHSRSDRNRYRSREEIEDWKARDPIVRFEAEIAALGLVESGEIVAVAAEVEKEMAEAIAAATASPWPSVADVARDVYSGPGDSGLMSLRELSYAEAIREALAIALESDERVFLMGEDIGVYGGAFQVTGDLVERFGEDRVMDTPISELGGAGVAVGAALTGMLPVYEFQFSDFSMLAMEQIVNQAAKLRYMLGGSVHVPVVYRMPTGSGLGGAAQHSQSIEAWYAHVPGLKVVEPSTPAEVKGMLLAAIKDPDPVIVFEHKLLYKTKGAVPEGAYETPLDKAIVRRAGGDLTIVATAIMVHRALEGAEILAKDGIGGEVIDLRCLRPIDQPAIVESVKKTARLLAVYEGVKTLGIGSEISALVAESEAFDYLEAPIIRLGGAEAPIPYSPVLEKAAVPQVEDIITAARRLALGEV